MAKIILILLGTIQIISGLVIMGIYAAVFHKNVSSKIPSIPAVAVSQFGRLLIGLMVIAAGILGVIAGTTNKRMYIVYLIASAIAASVSAAIFWNNATTLAVCNDGGCFNSAYALIATLLMFSLLSLAVSITGTIITACVLRQQMLSTSEECLKTRDLKNVLK